MNKTMFVTTILTLSLATVPAAFAAGASGVPCQPIYGGGQTCDTAGTITLNKTVQDPATNTFVDNMDTNSTKFQANQKVTFHIDVKNTGKGDLTNVSVKDTLPQYVTFTSGTGNFDANTKTLSFSVDKLKAGEDKTYTVVATVAKQEQLPQDQATVCVVNQAQAVTTDGQTAGDQAQFCIGNQQQTTKGGLPVMPPTQVKTTPPTGPEELPMLMLIPTGVVGMLLRKKS